MGEECRSSAAVSRASSEAAAPAAAADIGALEAGGEEHAHRPDLGAGAAEGEGELADIATKAKRELAADGVAAVSAGGAGDLDHVVALRQVQDRERLVALARGVAHRGDGLVGRANPGDAPALVVDDGDVEIHRARPLGGDLH